jgi:serine/threonine protein kinase
MEKYLIEKKIGAGSFGSVRLATQISSGKKYAIKEIKTAKLNDIERKDAQKEVDFLSQLSHPSIVGYKESFVDPRSG